MKTMNLILALSAVLLFCGHVQAQDELPYRPFQTFGKDTVRYLDYNFMLRRDQYAGKAVADLIHDLELPVVYVSNLIVQLPSAIDARGYIPIMSLVIRMVGNKPDEWKDYYIRLDVGNGVDAGDFSKVAVEVQEDVIRWTPQLYEVMKNVEIVGIVSNEWLFQDRRKLLEIGTKESREQLKRIRAKEAEAWKVKNKSLKKEVKQTDNAEKHPKENGNNR